MYNFSPMIYTGKPQYFIYVIAIFLYISLYNLIIDFRGIQIAIYAFIILSIGGILYYWKNESYNTTPIYLGLIMVIFNGLRYYYVGGFIIEDEVVESFYGNYLKKYPFISMNQQGYGQWLIKKINNQWLVQWIQPMIEKPAAKSLINFFQNKFPNHYGFFLGILLGNKDYFQPYRCFNHLGLGHYTAVSGVHIHLLFNLIVGIIRIIFMRFPIIAYYWGFGLGLSAIAFLNYINTTPF